MNHTLPQCLILGANGFLGWNATKKIIETGWHVKAFDKNWDIQKIQSIDKRNLLSVHEASIFDQEALRYSMLGTDVVLNFLLFTVPITTPRFLQTEIQTTIQAMENILATMVEVGTKRIVFPSSGGTIYGNIGRRPAKESDEAKPVSSYGMGKLLCELMIRFYMRVHGLNYTIMRISNAYGAFHLTRVSQGLIDVFLERIISGEQLTLWGDGDQVRDFIFIEDVMDAMVRLLMVEDPSSVTVNVGSGQGRTIREVISILQDVVGFEIDVIQQQEVYAGIPYSVLDIGFIEALLSWTPNFSLEEGIKEAWLRKRSVTGV